MSNVTNIMIRCTYLGDDPAGPYAIVLLNQWLAQDGIGRPPLKSPTEIETDKPPGQRLPKWGGSHAPELDLWVGSYNRLDAEKLRNVFEKLPWHTDVQLFVQDDGDATFGVWMFVGYAVGGRVFSTEVVPVDLRDAFLHCVLPPVRS